MWYFGIGWAFRMNYPMLLRFMGLWLSKRTWLHVVMTLTYYWQNWRSLRVCIVYRFACEDIRSHTLLSCKRRVYAWELWKVGFGILLRIVKFSLISLFLLVSLLSFYMYIYEDITRKWVSEVTSSYSISWTSFVQL